MEKDGLYCHAEPQQTLASMETYNIHTCMQTYIDMENIEIAGNTKNEVDPIVKNKSPHF